MTSVHEFVDPEAYPRARARLHESRLRAEERLRGAPSPTDRDPRVASKARANGHDPEIGRMVVCRHCRRPWTDTLIEVQCTNHAAQNAAELARAA
jgi:hypothetical protein